MENKVCIKIKPGKKEFMKDKIKFNELARRVGVNRCYMSEIMNGRRQTISKTLAYAICKAISPELEVSDIFNIDVK